MPFYIALIASIGLHAALIIGPAWLALAPEPPAPQRIEARLLPVEDAVEMAESVSTEPLTPDPVTAPLTAPKQMQGESLRRAQANLSRHLYYPPEAVAKGMEGEAILLLTLTQTGQLLTIEIARSSGHALLDQAALDAARRIGRLPGGQRQMLFPVSFRLQ
jgi:protein TonB